MATHRVHRRLTVEELEPRVALSDLPLHPGVPVTFTDAFAHQVTVTLTGRGGFGMINVDVDPGVGDNTRITLTNTGAGNSLTIYTPGKNVQTTLAGVQVTGSLGSLNAKTTNLAGDLTITGSLASVVLGNINGKVDIGPAALRGGAALRFGSAGDLVIDSDSPLKSVTVENWNHDTVGGSITAPAVGAVRVNAGDLPTSIHATSGSIGDVTVIGGDLLGSLDASLRIGNITVKGVEYFVNDQGGVHGGSIRSAQIRAGQLNGRSIGNITLTAGSLGAAGSPVQIIATGDIGNIITRGIGYLDSFAPPDPDAEETGGAPEAVFGFQGGGVWVNLDTSGKLGNVSACDGGLGGTIHAFRGIGNVKVETVMHQYPMNPGEECACLSASLATENRIGNVSINCGCAHGVTLSAGQAIGNVNIQGMGINASRQPGGFDGCYMGGPLQAHIYLGRAGVVNNPLARMGIIRCTGVDVTVDGNVPDPNKVKIFVKPVAYIQSYNFAPDPHHPTRVMATAGTTVSSSGLCCWPA